MSTRSPKKKGNNNLYYIVGAVVAVVIAGALIAVSLAGGDGTDKAADDATIAAIQENVDGIPAEGLILGDPDAPVTITEYSDVACIHCRTAALESIPDVVDQVVRTGQAKLEYAPTAFISASSERGALGVLAAAELDAAWPFAEAIFHIQGSASTDWLSDEDMEGIAEQLGLDVAAWREAYASADIEQRFIATRDAVIEAEVQSTPTFVVTGPGGSERIEGAVPAATLIQAVQQVSAPS